MGQGGGREAGRGASCGTLSERVLSCYLYDRGWQGGGGKGKSRSDKSLKSSAIPGKGGEKRRRHVIICANSARGAAITLLFYTCGGSRVLNAPLVLSVFF